jgi:hypothetical protein
VGYYALRVSTGTGNTAVGDLALSVNNIANFNTAVGANTLSSNTTGLNNSALGAGALLFNTTSSDNTAIGANALLNNTASENTAVGTNALQANTIATGNVAVGVNALASNIGDSYNTAGGWNALRFQDSGQGNVAIGANAQANATAGFSNISIGNDTLFNNLTGVSNVAVGASALVSTTGSNNTHLGYLAGAAGSPFEVTTQSNRVIVGDNSVSNAYIRVAWTVTSDARDKTNIGDIPHGLNFVQQLQPKQYQFKTSREDDTPQGNLRYGFLAQDILALEGDTPVVIDNEMPDHLKYQGESLVPILVKAIQELKTIVDAQAAEIAELKAKVA